jgi:hypothetical protein
MHVTHAALHRVGSETHGVSHHELFPFHSSAVACMHFKHMPCEAVSKHHAESCACYQVPAIKCLLSSACYQAPAIKHRAETPGCARRRHCAYCVGGGGGHSPLQLSSGQQLQAHTATAGHAAATRIDGPKHANAAAPPPIHACMQAHATTPACLQPIPAARWLQPSITCLQHAKSLVSNRAAHALTVGWPEASLQTLRMHAGLDVSQPGHKPDVCLNSVDCTQRASEARGAALPTEATEHSLVACWRPACSRRRQRSVGSQARLCGSPRFPV